MSGTKENESLALNLTASADPTEIQEIMEDTDLAMEEINNKFDDNLAINVSETAEQSIDNIISKDEGDLSTEKLENSSSVPEHSENDCTADLVGLLFEKDGEGNMRRNECKVITQEQGEDPDDEKLTLPEITITRPSESESVAEEDTLVETMRSPEEQEDVIVFAGEHNSEMDKDIEESENEEMNNDFGEEDDELMRGSSIMYFPQREVRNGKVIGEGGFGRVLKGNLHGGTPVAIKLFHAPFTRLRDPNELEKLLGLNHKNIVAVFGIVEQTVQFDCPQLVFQYVSEGSVLQYLSRHENPEDNTTLGKIALDIVEGCQYLQKCGIVHGNLSARNILVERVVGRHKTYYNAKISDIGFIKFAEGSGGNYMKLPGGDRIIPVRWVPKEIIDVQEDGSIGSDFTFKSDVWSFGVVLWEIWTRGAIPYGASYSNLRVVQFLMDGFSPLKVHRPSECPPKVISVMESIFRVDPAERPSFDEIYGSFKSYKGYGKENKIKTTVKSVSQKGHSKYSTTATSGADDSSGGATSSMEVTTSDQLNSKFDEKLKKKKIKKNKKAFSGSKVEDEAATSQGGAAAMFSDVPQVSPKPTYKKEASVNQQESGTDSTIAALLKRVNQLEKERRGGGYMARGGGGAGNGPSSPHWQKRVGQGPPRFQRGRGGLGGYHHHTDYIEDGGSPVAVERGISAASPLPPPPASSHAPPPYTEDPLPHHSTSRFSAPLPEYEYGGTGRRGSRGTFSRDRIPEMGRPGAPQERVIGGEEDYIRKVKRLAEEIEVLRAEKMTQELLKKSAELAEVMKIMTTERSKLPVESPRYSSGSSGVRGEIGIGRGAIPPRLVRRTRYYEDDDYDNNYEYGHGQHFDGPHQHHRSWNSRGVHRRDRETNQVSYTPPQSSHQYGNSQRRPYYMKSRGGTGGANGNRGGYSGGGGRYHDSDDTSYGQ